MKKKQVILSFDYELFFGDQSGTVVNTLIRPTNQLLDIMEDCGFRGNFFVDWQMLKYLKGATTKRTDEDLELIINQLKDIVRRGHRIELHIHPHWVDAKYNGDGTWDFSEFRHYSLNSFNEDEIIQMFKEGTQLLNSIAREIVPNYKICAFRAGGWAVQPFDKLKKAFIESGIIIDSSTSIGCYNFYSDSYYDFRKMPDKSLFHFENDVCVEDVKGKFIEVPITSFHRNLLLVLIDRIYGSKFHYFDKMTDGTHSRKSSNCSNQHKKSFIDKIKGNHKLMFSFSMQSPITIKCALSTYRHLDICCYIDHPKDFSKATEKGIRVLKNRCESVNYIQLCDK